MDRNLTRYNDPEVVKHYKDQGGLFPAESYLVGQHVPEGAAILDVGVGGGRTVAALNARAGRYVGADYSAAMVAACRARFPGLTFVEADATSMPHFADGEFDAVLFSFNGIDCIPSDEGRASALREIARVLRPGGSFLMSSHNARMLLNLPRYAGAKPHQAIWRSLRAVSKSITVGSRNIRSGAFSRGEGYIVDPVHGGLDMYVSTPQTLRPQLEAAGFDLIEVVGGLHPSRVPDVAQPWWYYAGRKRPLRRS